jgi:hypothetical protein
MFLFLSFWLEWNIPRALNQTTVVVMFIAMAWGMHKTHKVVFRIQCERRAAQSARAPAPWDVRP